MGLGWESIVIPIILLYAIAFQFKSTNDVSEYMRQGLKVLPQEFLESQNQTGLNHVAYVQYATNDIYFKLATDNMVDLRNGNATGDLIILYSEEVQPSLHQEIITANNIKLIPVESILSLIDSEWRYSLTKLHIFLLQDYDCVIYFDADSMLMSSNLDELFNIPEDIDIAMTHAYWLSDLKLHIKEIPVNGISANREPSTILSDKHKLENRENFFATHIIVFRPKRTQFKNVVKHISSSWFLKDIDYDMEVINRYLNYGLKKKKLKIGILDHRIYGVLTGELKEKNHGKFVADPQYVPFIDPENNNGWRPLELIEKAKLIHFSDDPIPKPWVEEEDDAHYNSFKIACKGDDIEKYASKPRVVDDCDSVRVWEQIRRDFKQRRHITH